MTIWFIILWADEDMTHQTVECQRHDWPKVGFEAEYKAIVRRQGGRVIAVVRPKRSTTTRSLNWRDAETT